MTLLKSETAENASHYEQEVMQKERREGKTQIEAKGCCCLGQRRMHSSHGKKYMKNRGSTRGNYTYYITRISKTSVKGRKLVGQKLENRP